MSSSKSATFAAKPKPHHPGKKAAKTGNAEPVPVGDDDDAPNVHSVFFDLEGELETVMENEDAEDEVTHESDVDDASSSGSDDSDDDSSEGSDSDSSTTPVEPVGEHPLAAVAAAGLIFKFSRQIVIFTPRKAHVILFWRPQLFCCSCNSCFAFLAASLNQQKRD